MQYSLKFAAVSLFGLANIVSALPTETTTVAPPPAYGDTTSCTKKTETSYSTGKITTYTTKYTTVYVPVTTSKCYTR